MHSCPRCGMECDCSGDWDDIQVMNDDWVNKNCKCDCEHFSSDEFDPDEIEVLECPNCGMEYDEIDQEYLICHHCGHDAEYKEGKEVSNG